MKEPEKMPPAPMFALRDLLADFRADADAAHEAKLTGKPRGAISGIDALDAELNGAFAPGLNIVHGNAGTGKTALALQIACECHYPALFVTCEMAPAELLRRITARVTGKYLGRLKSGEMSGDQAEALARQAIEAVPDLFILDATRGATPPMELLERVKICQSQYPDAGHFLLVIDSLQTYTQSVAGGLASEYEALNAAIRGIQMMAAELKQPVLLTSERNRDSMKSGGLNAGAGTRKIEYQAETVIDLERGENVPDARGEVEIILKLVKNRHGAVGKEIPLSFNGALQRFTLADGEAAAEYLTNGSQRNGVKVRTASLL